MSLVFILQFFTTEPYACEPSSLPKYPPSKELDVKLRDEEARRFVYSSFLSTFFFFWTCIMAMLKGDLYLSNFLLRQRGLGGKGNAVDGARKTRIRDRAGWAIPAPEANAENPANLDVCEGLSLVTLNIICFSI